MHVAPFVPHCDGVPGETQVVPLQQPVGHELASHRHTPLKHRWPTLQAAVVPQRQVPFPQLFASRLSQVWH